MRYLDSGDRDPNQTLGAWFGSVLTPDVAEVRLQSGFFYLEGLGLLLPTLERLKTSGGIVRAVVGANQKMTLCDDVVELAKAIGIPRSSGGLGVVSFDGGLFHPKTFHLTRSDGSECAFVGSNNLTRSGVSGLNIEAGIALDSRDGDALVTLREIAHKVDRWFDTANPAGFYLIPDLPTVRALCDAGILVEALPTKKNVEADDADDDDQSSPRPARAKRDRLLPLVTMPVMRKRRRPPAPAPPSRNQSSQASVPNPAFPGFLFEPGSTQPTSGASALSGATLPSGASGLILRLNKDSARHFSGRMGTANISIPLPTIGTVRFGLYKRKFERPRAEFELLARYLSDGIRIYAKPLETAIMPYGYVSGESGNQDVRMLVPAAVRGLAAEIKKSGHPVPKIDDLALLEWPTPEHPNFRISYLGVGSTIASDTFAIYKKADAAGEVVGRGAWWLPPKFSPDWP